MPFGLLGSGKIVFERIGPNYQTDYIVDATAGRSDHILDNMMADGLSLSPDGRRLAYLQVSQQGTGADVYIAHSDGSRPRHVTSFGADEGPPTWTPDGAKIVVAGSDDGLVWSTYSVSAVDDETFGFPVQLTGLSSDSSGDDVCPNIFNNAAPVTMSAGGALAFLCSPAEIDADAPTGARQIDVVAPTGALVASYAPALGDLRHEPTLYAPAWSPDGTGVAFVETTSNSAANYALTDLAVKIMNADGDVRTVVDVDMHGDSIYSSNGNAFVGPNNFSLCWMPDGSRLVFNIPESPRVSRIWVVHADGSGLAQLTFAPDVWDRSVSCSR